MAAHEGQLFGIFNQLLDLFTVMGLLLLSASAVILWLAAASCRRTRSTNPNQQAKVLLGTGRSHRGIRVTSATSSGNS
jgi:uncharacterized iron-regulated membrane protein